MKTKEAAERLRGMDYRIVEWWATDGASYSLVQAVKATDAAERIAAEYQHGVADALSDNAGIAARVRRATVERIRAAIDIERHDTAEASVEFFALERILDEEAER